MGMVLGAEVVSFWGDMVGTVGDTVVINYYMEREYYMINGTPLSQTSCEQSILEELVKANNVY